MAGLRVGLLRKKRGNFAIQEKFIGAGKVMDTTDGEVEHHEKALTDAGYSVQKINWTANIIHILRASRVDLVFNVSSLAEAAILEELGMPYVGSDTCTIASTLNKAVAKRLWQQAGLPTSPFRVASTVDDCRAFEYGPPFDYPMFVKPVAGRGSAGIDDSSVVHNYEELSRSVARRIETIRQPVLIERYLRGREITLGILGNDAARVLPPLEITYRKGDVTLTY
mgnify:CR=1 FL=1